MSSHGYSRGTAGRAVSHLASSAQIAAFLCLLSALGPWASTSQAAPEADATFVEQPFTLPDGEGVADGQAFCPAGSRVVGGGVTSTMPAATEDAHVVVSGPLDETGLTENLNDGDVGRSWYAKVVGDSAAKPKTFISIAICSQASDATLRVGSFTLEYDEASDYGQASCPAGSRVVGGGITSTNPGKVTIDQSGPLDETGLPQNLADGDVGRSWYAEASHYFANFERTYVLAAICSAASDATLRVARFSLADMTTGAGQAFCPAGSRVVGGGVTGTGRGRHSSVLGSAPLAENGLTQAPNDGDVGRSWYAKVENNFYGPDTFVSTAICAPEPTEGPPPGDGPPPPPRDTILPELLSAKLTNTRFAVNPKGPSETLVTARRRAPAKKGTTFVHRLSEAARVLFRIDQRARGRIMDGLCRKPTRSNQAEPACTRFVHKGTFAQEGAAGENRKKFSGRLGKRTLRPGLYRAVLTAKDAAGNVSQQRVRSFRVVAR